MLLCVFSALLVIYYSTVVSFYNIYSEEGSGQTHAPLLLLVSLYLLYRAWSRGGRHINLRFNYLAIALVIPLTLLWMLLGLVFVEAGQQAMLIMIAVMVVIGLLGIRTGRKYLMPILLLLSVVPVWNVAIPYLQTAATLVSAFLLDLFGITSIREGYLLIIPNGTFEVAGACSGMKFQVVGITLALIHTQLIKVPIRITLIYVLLASLLAFISNAVRIVAVVAIGYHYGMDHEYVQDHNFIGWIVFSILFFLYIYLGERWLQNHQIEQSATESEQHSSRGMMHQVAGGAMVILAFSVGPILHGYFLHRDHVPDHRDISVLSQLSGWRMTSDQLTEWTPVWTAGDHSLQGRFASDDEKVDLFVTKFTRQRQGHEAVNASHRVYDIEKWSRISRSAKVVKLSETVEVTVEETLLKSPTRRQRLVWRWYRTNDKILASNIQAKLNNLIGVIAGKPDITVFVLSKEISRNQSHAADVLGIFLKDYIAQGGIS